MQLLRHHHRTGEPRRGLTTPAVAIALLVTMAGLALILDRIWLETAQLELTTAAEVTALAAARQLAADDRLESVADAAQRLDAAREAAAHISQGNLVIGQPPSFAATDPDILFGRYAASSEDGAIVLDTDATDPLTVRITLHRSRARHNPVALFIGELTGVSFGDVRRQADATVNNQIAGVRPVSGGTAPALPIAVLKADPAGNRHDTWQVQIEQRRGPDQFRYDHATHQVVSGTDGIPEMAVRSLKRGGRPELCNFQVLDLGTGFDDEKLSRQFRSGWTNEDLADFGGALTLDGGKVFSSSANLLSQERDDLESLLGEPRICLLFNAVVPTRDQTLQQTTCVEFVAVRVMSVQDQSDGSCLIVLQPTVMATRAAVIATAIGRPSTQPPNKYIYNLQLTN